jgi:glutamate racemase
MKIGFFDSGLGGLIILKAVAKHLPEYDYEFYGDTAHLPYGDRSEEEIFALTKAGILHLFTRECALVVVACNTASAETLRRLQDTILVDEFADRRILGVIIPTVEAVCDSGEKQVVLLATKRTVESGKYDREFAVRDSRIVLMSIALPGLVPLIERGDLTKAEAMIRDTLQTLPAIEGPRAVILGCTHYSLLKDVVRAHTAQRGEVFSQDEIIPAKLNDYLHRHPEIETRLSRGGLRNVYLTDAHRYDDVLRHLLGGVLLQEGT